MSNIISRIMNQPLSATFTDNNDIVTDSKNLTFW